MPLTLKIISPSSLPQGQSQECFFDELGGTIGRKPHNSFVLIDPERFISSQHADIAFNNGKFVITDTSTNGVFINDDTQPLGASNSRPLSNGDKVNIGDFQLEVLVNEQTGQINGDLWQQQSTADSLSSPASDDPFSLLEPSTPANSLGQELPVDTNMTSGFFGEESADSSVDPMALLDGGGHSSAENPASSELNLMGEQPDQDPFSDLGFSGGSSVNNNDDVNDFFANNNATIPPPSPLHEPFTPPSAIPDDWDIMGDENSPKPANTTNPLAADEDIFATLNSSTPVSQTQRLQTQIPEMAVEAMPENHSIDDFLVDNNVAPVATPAPPHVQARTSETVEEPIKPSSPAPQKNEEAVLLEAFFHGAGVDPKRLNFADQRALMAKVGLLARTNTEGLMLALRARTTIKSSFRVNKTIIAPVENNPLKFLVTADDALSTLLSDDRQGYMPAKQAVDEGYGDLQTHQMAMMAGMQATIRAILHQFNPATLEQSFAGKSGSSIIPGAKKAKNWDHYGEFYKRISDQIADDFQNLFGEEFAKAYEQQVQKLSKL